MYSYSFKGIQCIKDSIATVFNIWRSVICGNDENIISNLSNRMHESLSISKRINYYISYDTWWDLRWRIFILLSRWFCPVIVKTSFDLILYVLNIFEKTWICICILNHPPVMSKAFEIFVMECKDLAILHNPYQSCWWPVNAMSQGIQFAQSNLGPTRFELIGKWR